MRKRIWGILLFVLLITGIWGSTIGVYASGAAEASVTAGQTSAAVSVGADYACLMDANTGVILYEKNMDTQTPPASVTKVMTCYLALEHGNLSDQVSMTQTGVDYAVGGLSNLNTKVGETFTLEQLLYGTMTKSANDMATQVGEYIGGGSLDNFVQMMNDEAAAMGCTNTHFANACGYPDDNNYTSCHDMAIIFSKALQLETFRTIIGAKSYTIPATSMTEERFFSSHVALLMDESGYHYDGTIGGKTGFTNAALNTLVVGAERNGMTLVAVSFHGAEAAVCAGDAVNLFDYGFNNFENIDLEDSEFPGYKGLATVPSGVTAEDLERTENVITSGDSELVELSYSYDGKTVGSITMTKAEYEMALSGEEESTDESVSESSSGGRTGFTIFGGDGEEDSKSFLPESFSELGSWIKSGPHLVFTLIFIVVVIALVLAIIMAVKSGLKERQRKKRRKARLLEKERRMNESNADDKDLPAEDFIEDFTGNFTEDSLEEDFTDDKKE